MILYSLSCSAEHEFEAWFRDGAAYEAQAAAGEIGCPVCGDTGVAKAPMAPRIAKGRASSAQEAAREAAQAPGEPQEGAVPAPSPDAPPDAPRGKALLDPRQREMARLRAALLTVKKLVEDNCEHVGADFPNEARRIHHGEAADRSIYGDATEEEAEALADEGIAVGRVPWPSASDA